MSGEVSAIHQRTHFTEACRLCERDGCQRHLGELGQVEQAIRVAEHLVTHNHLRRVVAHDGEDGEAEGVTGEAVGPLPNLARSVGGRHLFQRHTLTLDALTWVNVGGRRGSGCRGGA